MSRLNEDTLVQQTTAEYLRDELGWESVYAYNIVIVCAIWLTGFDVPGLSTMYLDKPLKAHTLMQAIARANRINEGKNNGLIVDYCGILKNLRKALATFAEHQGDDIIDGEQPEPEVDPVKPEEDLLEDLAEATGMVRDFLESKGFRLEDILKKTGFECNKAITDAKEIINENDRTHKKFEIMAREVFKKFKACLTLTGVNAYRHAYDAINFLYKSLQTDRDHADITEGDSMDLIFSDPDFYNAIRDVQSRLHNGTAEWYTFEVVFDE